MYKMHIVKKRCLSGIVFLFSLPIIPVALIIKGCEMCIIGIIDFFDNILKKKHDRNISDIYYDRKFEILNSAYHYFTSENAKLFNIPYEESHENMQKLSDQVWFL